MEKPSDETKSNAPNIPGAEKSFNEVGDCVFDCECACVQRFNDWLKLERLSFSERYAIGRLDICFMFEVGVVIESAKEAVIGPFRGKQNNLFCIRMRKRIMSPA
jgi:hypothetical protein